LREHPDAKPWIKRIVVMGGALEVGYNGKPPAEPEWNLKTDVAAAKAVFTSGVPLTVIPLDATAKLELGKASRDRLFAARTPVTFQLQNLYELWDKETPVLFDPAAIAALAAERLLVCMDMRLEIDDRGMTIRKDGTANARVAIAIAQDTFVDWFVARLSSH